MLCCSGPERCSGRRSQISKVVFAVTFLLLVMAVALLPAGRLQAQSGCCTVRGNVDCDPGGGVDIADLSRLIDYMLISFDPLCCPEAANVDGSIDGIVDISDLTLLIDHMLISLDPLDTCGPGTLSYLQRQALFDALDSVDNALSGKPADSVAILLAAFLNGRPEIDSAGVIDSISVWAWFVDGWVLSIPNNRFPEGGGMAGVGQPTPRLENDLPRDFVLPKRRFPDQFDPTLLPPPQASPSSAAFNYELPTSIQARVTSTLGSPPFTVGASMIKSLIESHGYVSVPFSGSVASLFGVQNDGVFYMDAHGGSCPDRSGALHLAIWTATVQSPANDVAFRSLLNRGELVLMRANDHDPTNGSVRVHQRYAFTGKFVAQYMYFVPNSVIFLNACESDSVPSMRNGFFTAGASVYCGWTKIVHDPAANKAAEFIFDRLLGANASTLTPKENPPQRPFDVDPVWQNMNNFHYNLDPLAPNALLRVERLQNHFGLLAPSIRYMAVLEHNDTLYITGMFGTDPGPSKRRVYVGGTDMLVYDWQPQMITCFIPNTGVGSVGPVTVEVDGLTGPSSSTKRKSNVVNLTEWNGQFTYTQNDFESLRGTIVLDARLRADIHSFRDKPHETPKYYSVIFPAKEDSYGTATVSGTASYTVPDSDPVNTITWTWHGTHTLQPLWENDPTGFLLTGYVDGNINQFRLHVVADEYRDLIETVSSTASETYDDNLSLQIPLELYDTPPGYFYIQMNTVWDILGDSRTVNTCCSRNPANETGIEDIVHTFSWPTIPASWAPDTTAAQ